MLVAPYTPVHVLLFSQPGPKGNARHDGNHLQEAVPDGKHVSVAKGRRAKKFGFHAHFLSTYVICWQ